MLLAEAAGCWGSEGAENSRVCLQWSHSSDVRESTGTGKLSKGSMALLGNGLFI